MKKEVNAKLIAERAGVSPSTVSMVLNNKGSEFRIAEKTVERILLAANELGYQHVSRARHKVKNYNQSLICAFCPVSFDSGPTINFYTHFQGYMKQQNLPYETILFPYEKNNLQDKISFLSSDFVAGAVMLALGENDVNFLESNKFDIPIVLYNRIANGLCSVLIDDYAVGSITMSHFIKRGHRRFGIISPEYSSRPISLRTVGYWDKLNSSFRSEETYTVTASGINDGDLGGYDAMLKILASQQLPTAIFVPIDNMISGVVRCIHDKGYRIPEDFELISYGNNGINCIVEPHVSSFSPPVEEMSVNCAKILHNAIANGILTDNIRMSFAAEFYSRESCPV